MEAKLVLEDGTVFVGQSFGAEQGAGGEVVFNTSMTGYQEILTDASYKGEIVTMTYPLIGNYGINEEDIESYQPHVEGFVVKEFCAQPSNWRSLDKLDNYLKENDIPGICGIDTRALTKKLRSSGVMKGIITTEQASKEELVAQAKAAPGLSDRDLVSKVTTDEVYQLDGADYRVVLVDYGAKENIIRSLKEEGCEVVVVPADASAEEILAHQPQGVMLSNGPGDPENIPYAVETVKELLGEVPIFGICLGHQVLAQALGATTYKLKFGHRGANHPVQDLETGRVYITAQNHGFAIEAESLDQAEVEITHRNLNDDTIEGIRHRDLAAFSVQYHPEASPGPEDSHYLFAEFIEMMENN
ncbi:glutamine-hydrolyzing carbamoyl-phosphate synthase small subunit [Fuchsiella alkaliacetigena]|uniref:glutamine-hydrolyzing carbamoyl-phosphate synthase small subunit n=1 Tax=Fuchsiella alkaliacetigena TaxID=957042 RepID=UPI00200A4A71|nr:glutamine-hydrolyzing carbamoyl-phosphate synthase small subunit [Fuchsiella alkaliacetigena]MCK8825322.1 glutamine-hydrolyzing carbamoyl-phosphate synthase small subunit [Fuchsiella alkaliacetigena]